MFLFITKPQWLHYRNQIAVEFTKARTPNPIIPTKPARTAIVFLRYAMSYFRIRQFQVYGSASSAAGKFTAKSASMQH